MLTISDARPAHHCQGFSRRDFLRVGTLALGGLSLTDALAASAQAETAPLVTGKSVVLLFLQGGPPHIEFFDPKMSAPIELTPLLLFGGGLKMGQVIGQSDGQAGRAITEPYRPWHLISTIMHVLFNIGRLRLASDMPREVSRLTEIGKPIDHLAS